MSYALEEESCKHKIVFTIEATINPLCYVLGAYVCTAWPEWCCLPDAGKNYDAMLSLAAAAGTGTKDMLPDIEGIKRVLSTMKLRARFDTKAHGPFLVNTDFAMSRDDFANYIDHLTPTEIEQKFLNNKAAKL